MRAWSIREWERLPYGDGEGKIPRHLGEQLCAVAQRSTFGGSSGQGVLTHEGDGLRAKGIVGIVAAADCQLEILPKIDGPSDTADADDWQVRNRLVHMLAVAHDLRIDDNASAELGQQQGTLLEIIIQLFSRKLLEAARKGLPRRYVAHEDDLPALRGRLNIARQFTTLAASPQRLACRFDELTTDIELNQVVKAVVTRLTALSRASQNLRMLRELAFAYADISDVAVSALPWDKITLDRTNERWRDLLGWARLILANTYQDTSAGKNGGYALLFEMNVLFERYVERLVKRVLAGSDWRVIGQGGHRPCLHRDGASHFSTKPDIIIHRRGKASLIIDTKWKRIPAHAVDRNEGVAQGDVYQMMAYSTLYECSKVMLLYPWHRGHGNDLHMRFQMEPRTTGNDLHVASINLGSTVRNAQEALRNLLRPLL